MVTPSGEAVIHQLPPKKLKMVMTTFGDWGNKLPVGEHGMPREFTFRPFNMVVNRRLGEIKDKAKGLTFGKFVTELLCVLTTSLGLESFETLNEPKRKLKLTMSWAADVLYMYFAARVQSMGPEITLTVSCPRCDAENKVPADLNTLDVRMIEDPTDMTFEAVLRDGLPYHGEVLKRLVLQPLRWQTMESAELAASGKNDAKRESLVIRSCVIGAEGHAPPFFLTEQDLDGLSHYDSVLIAEAIEENGPGPQVVVETKCEACGFEYRQMIHWEYERFFKVASPSRNGKK